MRRRGSDERRSPTSSVSSARARQLRLVVAALLLVLLASACTAPVRVTWETETEMNTAGFNLYRGLSPEGPFDVKVNDELIPPSADPLAGGSYSYLDRTAQSGVMYYYELQEIERDGGVARFGPISVRAGGLAGGLQWRHALVVGGLAVLVLLLWWRGGLALQRQRRENG